MSVYLQKYVTKWPFMFIIGKKHMFNFGRKEFAEITVVSKVKMIFIQNPSVLTFGIIFRVYNGPLGSILQPATKSYSICLVSFCPLLCHNCETWCLYVNGTGKGVSYRNCAFVSFSTEYCGINLIHWLPGAPISLERPSGNTCVNKFSRCAEPIIFDR